MTKVISFSEDQFTQHKQSPLSPSMVQTLMAACKKQNQGIHFGPSDIKGSFIALVTRGLIIRKQITKNDQSELLWQVTNEAIQLLKNMGIKISC
jgi:hypothetical protein